METWKLDKVADQLQTAALDASRWPEVLSQLSHAVDGVGAILFMKDSRVPGPPASPELAEGNTDYFLNGWNKRDERYRGWPLLQTQGVLVDQDFMTPEQITKSAFYQDFLRKHDCPWFAAIGFWAGQDFWNVTIQRSRRRGPFETEDVRQLRQLAKPLSDAAALSRHLELAQAFGATEGLQLIGKAAALFDDAGRVISLNEEAERSYAHLIDTVNRTLRFSTISDQAAFDTLLHGAIRSTLEDRSTPRTASVVDASGRQVLLRALVLRGRARTTFLGARILVLFSELKPARIPHSSISQMGYSLTNAEARLATMLCSGMSVAQAAIEMSVAYETVRSRLKEIYAKTGTHRQGELISLLLRTET